MAVSRRSFIKKGAVAGLAGAFTLPLSASSRRRKRGDRRRNRRLVSDSGRGLFFGYEPFTQEMPVPALLTPLTGADRLEPRPGAYPRPGGPSGVPATLRGVFDDVAHGIAPEFGHFPRFNARNSGFSVGDTHEHEFGLVMEETLHRYVPNGPEVPVFTYRDVTQPPGSGTVPGPTVVVPYREPAVVRCYNALTADRGTSGDGQVNSTGHAHESSIHLHGGHNTAHSDGYPDFYTLAGESRDYWYTNCGPQETNPDTLIAPVDGDNFDTTWIPTTMWYHDHAMDVTGYNVVRGLAGFYLVVDEREEKLAQRGVIPEPGGPYDIGIAVHDIRFNADGTVFYNFLDHNGYLGDTFLVNGKVQPYLNVEPRKYRFRMLNGSNARVHELRLSTRQKIGIIGADSWLLPRCIEVESFEISAGMRHDVIVDFSGYKDGDEVYLENIMIQEDGRKGKRVDPDRPTPLLKFKVVGDPLPEPEVPCVEGTVIRGFAVDVGEGVDDDPDLPGQWAPIREDEVVATRSFIFDRGAGAFTVNNRFFNPRRADAVPVLGYGAERWFLTNKAGGWWHPIHTHLEGHQVQSVNGKLPRRERRYNQDLTLLHGGETAETFIKFRTFSGPFAFHCHTIEHEDMRMMAVTDPTPSPDNTQAIDEARPLDGEHEIDSVVSGVVPSCLDLEHDHYIYFDVAGDVERLAGRGVGFEHCEFDMSLRGNRGRQKK
ncbi:MAG: multicopper oxidase domain-containing protein [Myxococcota bacterium]|nr:multicopper oxidase domain-containing protein [Myxococcota bacterium]